MKRLAPCLLLCLATFAGESCAQLFRAYLSAEGNDANPCTIQAPCRLLPAALAAVQSGGEVWMLDAANYNTATVNVTKSVTILAVPGVVGSVVAVGGPALAVATGTIHVALRNLVVVLLVGGGGTNGITVSGTGTTVTIDECQFANFPSYAITATGTLQLGVRNTVIRDSNGGITVSGGVSATASGVKVYNTLQPPAQLPGVTAFQVDAIVGGTTTTMVVEDSLAQGGRLGFGVTNTSPGGQSNGSGHLHMVRSTSSSNLFGVNANTFGTGTASIVMDGSTVVGSQNGVNTAQNGVVYTRGNNTIFNNGNDVLGNFVALGAR